MSFYLWPTPNSLIAWGGGSCSPGSISSRQAEPESWKTKNPYKFFCRECLVQAQGIRKHSAQLDVGDFSSQNVLFFPVLTCISSTPNYKWIFSIFSYKIHSPERGYLQDNYITVFSCYSFQFSWSSDIVKSALNVDFPGEFCPPCQLAALWGRGNPTADLSSRNAHTRALPAQQIKMNSTPFIWEIKFDQFDQASETKLLTKS